MESEAYENLLDYLTEQSSTRDGDVAASWNYLKRGARRLESGRPYQAIKLIGKSLAGLYKEESTNEMIFAMRIMASAYGEVGLPWASRASMLFAASMLTDKYWKRDELSVEQVNAYVRLSWTELQLGRLGQSLLWFELALVVQSGLDDKVISKNEVINYDGCISHLILNTPFSKLESFEFLPDYLDKLGLQSSRGMLLCSLGYEDDFSKEYEVSIDQKHRDFLIMVRDIDLGKDIRIFNDIVGKRGDIQSYLLGGKISINYPQKTPFIELAESIVAMLEGLLATAWVDELIPIESSISIEIIADDDDEISIVHEVEDLGQNLHIEITCSSFNIEAMNLAAQHEVQQWFMQFSIEILSRAFYIKEPDKLLETMFKDDRVLERSLSFGTSFMALHNIQGHDFVERVKCLFNGGGEKQYVLARKGPWDKALPSKVKMNNTVKNTSKHERKFSSKNEKTSHQELSISGIIKPRLWDKASWSGVGFSKYPNNDLGFSLLFGNGEGGKRIIDGIRSVVGPEDVKNRLRISIIKGVSQREPYKYRVVVSENFEKEDEGKLIMSISRIQTMTPTSLENLEHFLSEFKTQKSFVLGYGKMKNKQLIANSDNFMEGIKVNNIVVLDAWQVGINDIEQVAIKSHDDPIIPKGVSEPPVQEVIQSKKYR